MRRVGAPFVLLLAWLGVILFFSSQSTVPGEGILGLPDATRAVLGHLGLYGVLGVLVLWNACRTRPAWGWSLFGVMAASIFGFLWGALDEWHQRFVPGRDSSLGDMGVDTAGAFGGSVLLYLLYSFLHRSESARRE